LPAEASAIECCNNRSWNNW